MNLLVDLGNSRLKWRFGGPEAEDGAIGLSGDWPGALQRRWKSLGHPERVICVSVQSGRIEGMVNQVIAELWGICPEYVPSMVSCCGIQNGYAAPQHLGRDRLIAMVGARAITRAPVLVVDCGTAVTIDLLDGTGCHRGGWIMPGFALMRSSLFERAAALPKGTAPLSEADEPRFGNGTEAGIREGTRGAVTGAVLRAFDIASDIVGGAPDCLITGGDGNIVASALGNRCRYVPDLVLTGLARYADETFAE